MSSGSERAETDCWPFISAKLFSFKFASARHELPLYSILGCVVRLSLANTAEKRIEHKGRLRYTITAQKGR